MNFYEFFINATTEIPLFVVSYNPVCELRDNQMRIYIFTERHLKKFLYCLCNLLSERYKKCEFLFSRHAAKEILLFAI